MHMKKILAGLFVLLFAFMLTACEDAQVASDNISVAADNFEVDRRVVFYNGITDKYILVIEGRCSIDDEGDQLEVICKTGEDAYKKHFLGRSDNVTYFVEHLTETKASAYHYRVTFKPQAIVPDVDFRGSTSDIPKTD